MSETHDLSGYVCPISKIKATQVLNNLAAGKTATIILGDSDSFKSVALELKARGFKPSLKQDGEKYHLTVNK
jgi:TusA-related sulfurtransferase